MINKHNFSCYKVGSTIASFCLCRVRASNPPRRPVHRQATAGRPSSKREDHSTAFQSGWAGCYSHFSARPRAAMSS